MGAPEHVQFLTEFRSTESEHPVGWMCLTRGRGVRSETNGRRTDPTRVAATYDAFVAVRDIRA